MTRKKAATTEYEEPKQAATVGKSKTLPRKQWSKWLKVVGSVLLLFAFGVQINQTWQAAKSSDSIQAAEIEGRCIMKALEYQSLFKASELAKTPEPQYLQFAAQEYYHGRVGVVLTSPVGKAEKQRQIAELYKAANEVHDEKSLTDYFTVHNSWEETSHTREVEGIVEPSRTARVLGMAYFWVYILGSVVVVIGQMLEVIDATPPYNPS